MSLSTFQPLTPTRQRGWRPGLAALCACALLVVGANPSHGIERRSVPSQPQKDYQLFPLLYKIPGIEVGYGGGLALFNVAGTQVDIAGAVSAGGVEGYGLGIFDIHLVQDVLVFNLATLAHKMELPWYPRGVETKPNQRHYTQLKGARNIGQFSLRGFQRRLELFYRISTATTEVLTYRTLQGDIFKAKNSKHSFTSLAYGLLLDITDSRQAPRLGLRYVATQETIPLSDKNRSQYSILGQSVSVYLPFRQRNDVLELNLARSNTHSIRQGTQAATQAAKLVEVNCTTSTGRAMARCIELQARLTREQLAENRVGSGAALGGTNRLRSYALGRFRGSDSQFAGAEYRWNISGARAGGGLGWQLAFFAEQGKAADSSQALAKAAYRKSKGFGVRGWLGSVLLRLDAARGSEGSEVSLFAGLPWGGGFPARGL